MPITTTQLLGLEQMSSLRSLPWTLLSNPGRPFARRISPNPFSSRSSKRNVDEGSHSLFPQPANLRKETTPRSVQVRPPLRVAARCDFRNMQQSVSFHAHEFSAIPFQE